MRLFGEEVQAAKCLENNQRSLLWLLISINIILSGGLSERRSVGFPQGPWCEVICYFLNRYRPALFKGNIVSNLKHSPCIYWSSLPTADPVDRTKGQFRLRSGLSPPSGGRLRLLPGAEALASPRRHPPQPLYALFWPVICPEGKASAGLQTQALLGSPHSPSWFRCVVCSHMAFIPIQLAVHSIPSLPTSSFSNVLGSWASMLPPILCGWVKCLTLYKESKISDINCLHLPILHLEIFCSFHSPCHLLFQLRQAKTAPRRLTPLSHPLGSLWGPGLPRCLSCCIFPL